MSTPADYDTDPERYRTGMRLAREQVPSGANLYARIAAELAADGARLVLDLGCGEGVLAASVESTMDATLVSVDRSTLLAAAPAPAVRADARALPFRADAFDAVVAVNVLDHLPRPAAALTEAHRVLRPGGLLLTACTARADSPELAHVWTPAATPFDAEDAPGIVATVFTGVRVRRWDEPLVRLPDTAAVADYLRARFVPRADAARLASRVDTPLWITKRGALVSGRKTGPPG